MTDQKYGDRRFTRTQVDRILAEATERQTRDYGTEIGEGLTYAQIVQSAEEAGIDRKYLERSTKDLVREAGGLERAAVGRMFGKTRKAIVGTEKFLGHTLESFFIFPTSVLKINSGEVSKWYQGVGVFIGAVADAALLISLTAIASGDQKITDYPYLLALASITAATQVASSLYEWYRHERNKLVEEIGKEENKK
jgi:hypothetical protein